MLDERHHCEPQQQPILGIWLLLGIFSSERGFQPEQGRAAAGPSHCRCCQTPAFPSPVAKLSSSWHAGSRSWGKAVPLGAAPQRPEQLPGPRKRHQSAGFATALFGTAGAGGHGASSKAQALFCIEQTPFPPPSPGCPGPAQRSPRGAGRYLPAAGR